MKACAKGGDNKSKGANAALGMILIRSLPPGKQQLIEGGVGAGEIFIDPTALSVPDDQAAVVESIISIVTKDSASDAIRRLENLHRQATCCTRKSSELIGVL